MAAKLLDGAYKAIFYNSQSPMLIIDIDAPQYTMLDVNKAYLQATNTNRQDLVGKPVLSVFPPNPAGHASKNAERIISSFDQAIKNKVAHVLSNYRYDIPVPGTGESEEMYWTISNTPVLDEQGEVIYFIHSLINVTELNKITQKERLGVE